MPSQFAFTLRCPICDGNSFIKDLDIFDDRYGEPNLYSLASCNRCGHLITAPRLAESDLPSLYGTYYPRKQLCINDVIQDAGQVKRTFSKFIRWWNGTDNQGQYGVRAGETMLDVGCGSGVSLLEAQALGARAFGIEADPNVKPIAVTLGLKVHFGSLRDKPFSEQSFDLIIMNQVVEHLPNPDEDLCLLKERLRPNGRMVLVFPNVDSFWRRLSGPRWINWHIPYHLHHFNLSHFKIMAQKCGLEVVRSRSITPNVWSLLQLRASRYQPQRGQPSPIWAEVDHSEIPHRGIRKANPVRGILRFSVLSAFAVLNRVIDALGIGDSLLVELRLEGKQ